MWAAIGTSSVGDGALVAAMPLLAAYLTRNPIGVAIVSAAEALPWFAVGVFAGAWVDRLPRRRVMIAADLLRALALALLVALIVAGHASIAALAVVAFLATAGQCFFDAAAQALLPQVIGREGPALTKANGRIFATQTVGATLAGPPLGGVLFGVAPWAPFAVDLASFGASAALVTQLPAMPAPETRPGVGIAASVREGFAYLFNSARLVSLALGLTAYNVGYNMAGATLVLYVQDRYHVTNGAFGLLLASGAVGAVIVGAVSRPILDRLGIAGAVVLSGVVQGAAWAGIAWAGSPWLAAPALAVLGGTSTLITVAVVSERQRTVPDQLLGRVVSAFRLIGNGFGPVGGVIGGLIASAEGLRAPLVTGSVFLLISSLCVGWLMRRSESEAS